ncbi:hypothetical protein RZS08_48160, partial [Arthrospira platensis SPKY1]|nr:hypothetical protein [Arthrospira platensis SPKY1]
KNNKLYPLLIGNVSINGNICLGNYRYNNIEEEIIELNEYENKFFNRLYTIEDLFIYKKLKEYPLNSIYLKKDINNLNFNLINFNMDDQDNLFLYNIKSYEKLQKEEYRIIKTDNKFLEKIELFLE